MRFGSRNQWKLNVSATRHLIHISCIRNRGKQNHREFIVLLFKYISQKINHFPSVFDPDCDLPMDFLLSKCRDKDPKLFSSDPGSAGVKNGSRSGSRSYLKSKWKKYIYKLSRQASNSILYTIILSLNLLILVYILFKMKIIS